MIRFRSSARAMIRRVEMSPLPGLRARLWMVPYPGYEPSGASPWTGAYAGPCADAQVEPGSASAAAWAGSLPAGSTGPIVVGPVHPREDVYGAAAAAASGARSRNLSVVLLDGEPADEGVDPGRDLVAIRVWRAGAENAIWRRGSGVALPLIPGWTADPEFLLGFFRRAKAEGAPFAAPMEIGSDGASRAAIHRDYAAAYPEKSDAFFERLHHGDVLAEIKAARARFDEAGLREGIPTRVPLPVAESDFEANIRARAALEEEADRRPEPDAARLRSAARRIEELGRDLALLVREGNARLWFERSSPEWPIIESIAGPPKGEGP